MLIFVFSYLITIFYSFIFNLIHVWLASHPFRQRLAKHAPQMPQKAVQKDGQR